MTTQSNVTNIAHVEVEMIKIKGQIAGNTPHTCSQLVSREAKLTLAIKLLSTNTLDGPASMRYGLSLVSLAFRYVLATIFGIERCSNSGFKSNMATVTLCSVTKK